MASENSEPKRPEAFTSDDIFQCRQCGECCHGFGGNYVSDADIEAIAEYVNMPVDEFMEKCCRKSGKRWVLAQGEDEYCMFFKDKLCSIHPVKPRMCRAWPFIENVLKEVSNWRLMADACPGIRTDVPDEAIRHCVREEIKKRGWSKA